MNIEKYIEKIKNIEDILLEFLDTEASTEECFLNLTNIIDKNKICNDKHELALFLHIISKLSKNHHRYHSFISNLERILRYYSNDIQKKLTNSEIFKIFKGSKRILLFLFEEKIITLDKYIIENLICYKCRKAKYPQYFLPEIKPFMNEEWFPKYKQDENEWVKELDIQIPDDFYELRKEGENESYICKLIRNDSIKEFIVYVNKKNCSLRSTINPSIYETNSFLVKNQIESGKMTLINYAAFFGSIQILKYLQLNGVELTPQLWIFAIFSKNGEIIHFLEENLIKPIKRNNYINEYQECLFTSISCHHNDIANYFLNNYFQINDAKSNSFVNQCLKSYNFSFIQSELINENTFYCVCQYDYFSLISLLLNDKDFDVNKILIQIIQSNLVINNFNSIQKLYVLMIFKIIY